jgi:sugar lactone lactonase YvrE
MDPAVIPDFRPPLPPANSARADADGNLWIRIIPSVPTPGGFVYDIINPAGELVSRYQIPTGYTILGFGEGRIVYLSMRDASGIHLARVRLR